METIREQLSGIREQTGLGPPLTEVVVMDLMLPQAEWWDRENRDLHAGVRTKPCSWVLWSFHILKFISTAV